jgi:hypothetical protein
MIHKKHQILWGPGQKNRGKFSILSLATLAVFSFTMGRGGQEAEGLRFVSGRVYRLTVASNVQWTDTSYDVEGEQTLFFSASGGISLQVGNPMAYCGPDGYDLKTVQQPIQDRNIGALIGKVVLLISIEVDEETREEKRNEIEEIFFIGSARQVSLPISGRLFLGINENVVGDNSGQFTVDIRLGDLER